MLYLIGAWGIQEQTSVFIFINGNMNVVPSAKIDLWKFSLTLEFYEIVEETWKRILLDVTEKTELLVFSIWNEIQIPNSEQIYAFTKYNIPPEFCMMSSMKFSCVVWKW